MSNIFIYKRERGRKYTKNSQITEDRHQPKREGKGRKRGETTTNSRIWNELHKEKGIIIALIARIEN